MSRLTHEQRLRLSADAEARKTPAQKDTDRRIAALYRERFPLPGDELHDEEPHP